MLVEDQFLRVAQAGGEHLHLRAIGIRTKHRALVRHGDDGPFLRFDVCAAVTDREVQLAVGAKRQAVEVVTGVPKTYPEAGQQFLALGGDRGVRGVALQEPEAGDVGEPDLALAREHARRDAVEGGVERVGEDRAVIGDAIAIAILDQADEFTLERELLRLLRTEDLLDHAPAIFHGAQREVLFEHAHVVANIEHAGAVPIGLRHKQSAVFVERDRHRVGQHRLGGPEIYFQAGSHLEPRDGLLRVVRRLRDVGLRAALHRLEHERLGWQPQGTEQ